MRIVIIEDEKIAREHLQETVLALDSRIEIVAMMDNVQESISWLKANTCDLIFLDIHLSDDLSFSIFEEVKISTPIIFTTAYDQYAIKAFQVNAVDYLLKPIDQEELQSALTKYKEMHELSSKNLAAIKDAILNKDQQKYQERFMVKKGEKIGSIRAEDIAFFEGEDRYVTLVTKKNDKYFVDYKLSDLEKLLDPGIFFRFNRSFIGCFESIETIVTLSKSRVKVVLAPKTKRDIVVSTDNTKLFKQWLNR